MGVIFLGLWKTIGVSLLLFWAVTVLASALFIVLALKDDLDFLSALQRVPALVLPLVGLSLWIIIRSFVWVPFIGPILGVVLLPRLLCAPVVLVDEHKGVLESAKLSYERTRGYWGKIFGNMVVAAVCAFIGAFILTFVIGVFGEQVSVALAPVVNMLVTAFSTVFMVKLSLAVMRHPKGAVV
jgi:hypothetical protein